MWVGSLVVLLLGAPVWAGGPDRAAEAEAYRLSDEIDRLVKKGAWKGVERSYLRAVETGAELTAAVHVAGARSSMQIGDADQARSRLLLAYQADRDPDTLAWATTYSRQYTRVALRADPGAELQVERRHFDADRARVVDRAAEMLARDGHFEGLLPMGRYRVGPFWFTIREDDADVEADLRACAKDGECRDPS